MSDESLPATTRQGKCTATTKSGEPCRANSLAGKSVCLMHSDPELARELGRKGGKGNLHVKPEANPPEIPPLQTAAQIRDFLAQLMADVRTRLVDSKTASTLATLATSQLKAISAAELEERVSKLEKKVGTEAAIETESRLPSEEEWMRMFSSEQPFASRPESVAQERSKTTQPSGKPRTMFDDWTVPERMPANIEDADSVPLNRHERSYE